MYFTKKYAVHRIRFMGWGALKSVLSNVELGINEMKCLYEEVGASMAFNGAERRVTNGYS